MTKKYTVNVELKIHRAVWRNLGFGDQPSKTEVMAFYKLLRLEIDPQDRGKVSVRYMGAPGHYKVTIQVIVDSPWWRRLGFGDTISKAEIRDFFNEKTEKVSVRHLVTVQTGC